VILSGAGGDRQEVDLVAPPDKHAELPEAVCPAGVVTGADREVAEEAEPGTSPLDDGLENLRHALGEQAGAAEQGGDA
jgi:hypothetical protein